MREYALKCVWEKTTPLSGKNNTYPTALDLQREKAGKGIKLLYKTYKIFYSEEETEEMLLEQWEDLKAEIKG